MSAAPTLNDNKVGYTFMFLHGFPEYWQAWQSQLDYFSVKHHVIAPGLPCYNLSDKPEVISFFNTSNLIELG
ncbi:MAG: pimeloyl-ACP methyl ester carboxylesterase [Cognaticolwellia sp.]|jgi:pimeloyl-ACP methyl ester carboxylesterase